ncbi:MAG TPA: nickel-binding protein [Anaerolineales bacterium]|nr:nickel-binding protein [Anaerolineales bacterium]
MPIFMDRHYIEGATRHAIANAHERDLEIQSKHNVSFLTYWFDEVRSTSFCLVSAPDKEAVDKTHVEAHGMVPNEIIEVDPGVVEAFLGRIKDPVPAENNEPAIEPAFRVIMFTDLKDSTAMASRLGDARALHLLHIHNALTRNALRDFSGREVKHTGDGLMASFRTVYDAIRCAIAIQTAFAAHNDANPETPLYLRIGLSAGEPVEEDNDLFGTTVNLAARTCAHAEPGKILVTKIVHDQFHGEKSLFSDLGEITPKGFDNPVRVYEVKWPS